MNPNSTAVKFSAIPGARSINRSSTRSNSTPADASALPNSASSVIDRLEKVCAKSFSASPCSLVMVLNSLNRLICRCRSSPPRSNTGSNDGPTRPKILNKACERVETSLGRLLIPSDTLVRNCVTKSRACKSRLFGSIPKSSKEPNGIAKPVLASPMLRSARSIPRVSCAG